MEEGVAETLLTQAEADGLIALDKVAAEDLTYSYPGPGGRVVLPLLSADGREEFLVDVNRSSIDLAKVTKQLRGRQIVILVRVDISGPPHRNPDDVVVPCPHIHLYREGYADKWAYPLPSDKFTNPTDLWQTFEDFMKYCNVTQMPNVNRGLF
jgi:hypothetical protein